MYKQEHKAGIKQYIFSLFLCLVVWVLCDFIGAVIDNGFLADILFIVLMVIVIYLIYVHYCAVFVYEISQKKLTATRRIGRKEIKEEISLNKIKQVYFSKPESLPRNMVYMTAKIFRKKNLCYIIYDKGEKCLVIEPDEELTRILKESLNG